MQLCKLVDDENNWLMSRDERWEYAEMCDNIRGYDMIVIYGRDEYDRRMKLIQEKFDTVWAWIGKNIPNLWD